MTAVTSAVAPPRTGSRLGPVAVLRQVSAVSRRNLVRARNDPGQLIDSTLMPMALALVFIYVFGGAIGHDQDSYRQYLMPGIMVETASFASRATGIGMNLDFSNGVMDRFRSLPIARFSVLSGRIAAEFWRMLLGQIVMLAFAYLIGFRVHTGIVPTLAAIGVIMLFGVALCWVSAFIGLVVRSPETVQSVGFMWMVPLQFGSSMFTSPDTMPGWLRSFANVNPVSEVINTCRALLIGGPVTPYLWPALAWILGIVVVFAPLAVRRFLRRT
jgi:oleandomycin transport system permease protein